MVDVARASWLVALTSCQLVFPLDTDNPAAIDPCGVQSFDPLRYFDLRGNNQVWDGAKIGCERRAMHLVVFDTLEELNAVRTMGTLPFWLGVVGTGAGAPPMTLDGCPPVLSYGP